MNVKAQNFQSLCELVCKSLHGATIERHSLSQPFGLPAPSEREPGRGFHHSSGYLLKSQVSGDFHRPYGAQKTFPYTIQPADLVSEKSMVIIKKTY